MNTNFTIACTLVIGGSRTTVKKLDGYTTTTWPFEKNPFVELTIYVYMEIVIWI